jgi:hypothetical protein
VQVRMHVRKMQQHLLQQVQVQVQVAHQQGSRPHAVTPTQIAMVPSATDEELDESARLASLTSSSEVLCLTGSDHGRARWTAHEDQVRSPHPRACYVRSVHHQLE